MAGRFPELPPIDSAYLCAHFLQVEGNGKESEVHEDLFQPEVSETFIPHVVLHLPGHRLGFYGAAGTVHQSFFRVKPFARFPFVLSQAVVHLYGAVSRLGLEALSPERAAFTTRRPVLGRFRRVAACRPAVHGAAAVHALSHGADEVIPRNVVIKVIGPESVIPEWAAHFLVGPVVLDEGLHAVLFHEAVVLLRAVTAVGRRLLQEAGATDMERLEERYRRERVRGVGEQGEVRDELPLRAYLQGCTRTWSGRFAWRPPSCA